MQFTPAFSSLSIKAIDCSCKKNSTTDCAILPPISAISVSSSTDAFLKLSRVLYFADKIFAAFSPI